VLPGLSEVAWPDLRCASGPATAVADAIERLAAEDPDEAREAAQQLGYEQNEGGVVEPAAPAAVPFLVELVVSAATPCPDAVLQVLADLVPPEGERDMAGEVQCGYLAVPAPAQPLRVPVRAALAARLPELSRLLEDDDRRVRALVGRLLAGLGEPARAVLAELRVRVERETDPVAQASLILAAGALSSDTGWLDRTLASDLARTCAAVALGRAGAPPPRDVLRRAATHPPAGLDDEFC
jgi:HEAT repeat protein